MAVPPGGPRLKVEWRRGAIAALLVTAAILYSAWLADSYWVGDAEDDFIADVRTSNHVKLDHMLQFVSGSFTPIGGIPQILAVDGVFRQAVASAEGDPSRHDADTLLNNFSRKLGVDVVWLLDSRGICVAASNFATPTSFVGIDYSFRRYFTDAQAGHLGRQFAIGKVTGIPGLFYSAPIVADGKFAGAVVIKANLPRLAGELLEPGTFIADSEGVVILSRDTALMFHTVPGAHAARLSPEQRRHQYLTEDIAPIAVVPAGVAGHPEVVRFGGGNGPAVLSSLTVADEGLTLYAVAETPQIDAIRQRGDRLFAMVALAGILLGWVVAGLLVWRKHYQRQLHRVEREIAGLKARYELILRSAGDGIVGVGADEVVTFANPAACSMLKTGPQDLEGRPYRTALCGGDGISTLPQFPLAPGTGDAREQWFARGDGSVFIAEYILAPMLRGTVFEGATVVFRDVSLRKRYEEDLACHQRDLERQVVERTQTILEEVERRTQTEAAMKRAQSQALQASKLAAVGQLAAGLAHEINTPAQYVGDNLQFLDASVRRLLALIQAAEDLLARGDPAAAARFRDEEAAAKLDLLRPEMAMAIRESLDGVAQIARIVLSMKEFSHPGSHARTMTDLNHALDNTLTVSRNVWKHVAEVERRFDPTLPPVPCLASEMNQVFLNLIVNATQAIEASGKGFPGRIVVATSHDPEHVTIRISDSGTGVPEAIRDKIFDPFFTTKEVGKGTGQGLAICYDVVVSKHGGSLDVGGEEGEGAVFTIRLPVDDDGDAAPAVESGGDQPG